LKPQISEFSFGYALTEALVRDGSTPVIAAPLFPSLYQEGQAGGGYDLMLNMGMGFAFLQFKLSDRMVKRNAYECTNGGFTTPFFRMPLRPKRLSNQHEMLIELANQGHWVFYAAPAFHTQDEFNDAYINKSLVDRTFFIGPLEIGALPDDEDHHVTFDASYNSKVYSSTPRNVGGRMGRDWVANLEEDTRSRPRRMLTREAAEGATREVTELLSRFVRTRERLRLEQRLAAQEEHPLAQLATVSRTFLDCELLILRSPISQQLLPSTLDEGEVGPGEQAE
jgi:hypothetical protein